MTDLAETVEPGEAGKSETTPIVVTDVILHRLSKRTADCGFRPSADRLPTPSGDLQAFFAGHVERSLAQRSRRGARFVSKGAYEVPTLLQGLIVNDKFVENSVMVAKAMYDAMDARVRPASLAIVRFHSREHPDENSIALLKLDPTDAYRPVERNRGKPNHYWDLEVVLNVLPRTGEDLHKAAVVPVLDAARLDALPEHRPEHIGDEPVEFVILDRDVRGGAPRADEPLREGPYRKWWIEKFLQAASATTDLERIHTVRSALIDVRNELAGVVDDETLAKIDDLIASLADLDHVVVDAEIERLGVDEDIEDVIRRIFDEAGVPDGDIPVPEPFRDEFTTARWRGHHGLRVQIDATDIADVVETQDGDSWTITITTENWRRVR